MQLRTYQIADKNDSRKLAEFLAKDGQGLLPMVELLCQAEMAVDELIDVAGRATIEAVLTLSAQQVTSRKHPAKAAGQITWYGPPEDDHSIVRTQAADRETPPAMQGQRARQGSDHSGL